MLLIWAVVSKYFLQLAMMYLHVGSDPLPWQSMTRYPAHCNGVKFVDIDYEALMIKKRDVVRSQKELNCLLSNIEVANETVLLRSDQYFQVGCNLRDLKVLSRILEGIMNIETCLILLVAEVSITYMNVEAADALIRWAGTLPDGMRSTRTEFLR